GSYAGSTSVGMFFRVAVKDGKGTGTGTTLIAGNCSATLALTISPTGDITGEGQAVGACAGQRLDGKLQVTGRAQSEALDLYVGPVRIWLPRGAAGAASESVPLPVPRFDGA